MKALRNLLARIFIQTRVNQPDKNAQNIFDYSSKERVKLLRAAGREAQREQALLLQKYEAKFGQL